MNIMLVILRVLVTLTLVGVEVSAIAFLYCFLTKRPLLWLERKIKVPTLYELLTLPSFMLAFVSIAYFLDTITHPGAAHFLRNALLNAAAFVIGALSTLTFHSMGRHREIAQNAEDFARCTNRPSRPQVAVMLGNQRFNTSASAPRHPLLRFPLVSFLDR